MSRQLASSPRAAFALSLVEALRARFVGRLETASTAAGVTPGFRPVEWLRDDGRHGGGVRVANEGDALFDRASVNVSQVHYDDQPERRLGSATAISAIVHPKNPRAPSIHVHVSWTEMRDGSAYWRVMADLNPALVNAGDKEHFERALRRAATDTYPYGREQGERYFYIPALGRHRGVAHYYLEGWRTDDAAADAELARTVGEAAIDAYGEILLEARTRSTTGEDLSVQLAYHTLYFFQVLTLDRGTSAGLLVHDQNDVGILGSLPSHVDRALLNAWRRQVPAPQGELVEALLGALPEEAPAPVDVDQKRALAAALRDHYRRYPHALELQAAGDIKPPTVQNHLGLR